MTGLERLISHRFRGFDTHENTVDGLKAALDFGVLNLEFDIRVTRCGTPIIYHDEHAKDGRGKKRLIAGLMARDIPNLGGAFAHMPTADDLFKAASEHPNQDAKLLIDIKDGGFEEIIHALVCAHGLIGRVVYVSWLPNVLYAMHELSPETPLCLSHWCKSPNRAVRLLHTVHDAMDGHVPRLDRRYIHGERSGWFVNGGVKGTLRDMLKDTGGSVCVPVNMVTKDLVADYHANGIEVSCFSYVKWKTIHAHKDRFNVDLFFIDKKAVFDAL